jgi:hypothetical protein
VFTASKDEFVLVLFGANETNNREKVENVYFCQEDLQPAQLDWLKLLDREIRINPDAEGDGPHLSFPFSQLFPFSVPVLSALLVAMRFLLTSCSGKSDREVTTKSIVLFSNMEGRVREDRNSLDEFVNGCEQHGITLTVMYVST